MKTIDLSGTIGLAELVKISGVSNQAVYKWRKLHGLDDAAATIIPVGQRFLIRFDLKKVVAWAKEHGKQLSGLKTAPKAASKGRAKL